MSRDSDINVLLAEVTSYEKLPVGWDSYDGLPACGKAVSFAKEILLRLIHLPVPLPRVSPISTGVHLSWPNLDIEIDDESVIFDFKGHKDAVEDCEYDWRVAKKHIKEATE